MARRLTTIVLAMFISIVPLMAQSDAREWRKATRKIGKVLDYLRDNYVDEVPLDEIVEAALSATLSELDPHTRYLPREEMELMYERLHSKFAGIGISYTIYRDTIMVRSVAENSPAAHAGILRNDRLVGIDNRPIANIATDSIQELLRGDVGTMLTLDVVRHRYSSRHNIRLRREFIESPSVSVSTILNDSIAYLRIDSFARSTSQEVRRTLATMNGYNSLIIDVRGNVGGMLNAVLDISGLFLEKDDVIVSTEGRSERERHYRASRRGEYYDLPLAILIDEESASASEILAGAIQDHDRGVVIGRTSYGKGLVQRLVKLGDGDGMSVTRARYKTPSGRIIQRPYIMGERSEYQNDKTRYAHPDSAARDTTDIYYTLKSGRRVYGGGGIIPDCYIAVEHNKRYDYLLDVIRSGAIECVIIELFDHISEEEFISHYPTVTEYDADFELDDSSIARLQALLCDVNARYDANVVEEAQEQLRAMIRGIIARDIYGDGAYTFIYSRAYDVALSKAVAILSDRELMESLLSEK